MSNDYMTEGRASWITYADPEGTTPVNKRNPWRYALTREDQTDPVPDTRGVALFRRVFTVNDLKSARIDATALGVFDLWCNGRRVGRVENRETVYDELKPGWTDFNKRVLYYSYDLTDYLVNGENVLLAAVAPGWYHGRIALGAYGEDTHISFLAAIHLLDGDGSHVLFTNGDWDAAWGGAIRAGDIWDGEIYHAGFPDYEAISSHGTCVAWDAPVTERYNHLFVTPHLGPTVMVRKELTRAPEEILIYRGSEDNGSDHGKIRSLRSPRVGQAFTLRAGETARIDMGQNMVGWPTFTVKGEGGATMTVRVGEILNDSGMRSRFNDGPEGSIFTSNYRSAKAKIHYTLRGDTGGESYRPTFTFFGFRYCEITATEDVDILHFAGLVVGSATRETGRIETSNENVNRLISNILWSQRCNYLSVPTDCPQRDERLGWAGDTQGFCYTAAYNADVNGFFHKWLQDMRDSQDESGAYPDVAPYVPVIGYGGAGWADAGIIVPYTIWKMYNDTLIVESHFESMERYMEWIRVANDGNGARPTYGDWLACAGTDTAFISLAYYAMDAGYMAVMARAIGKEDRAAYYTDLRADIGEKFRLRYCDEDGCLKEEHLRSQTAPLMALKVGLLDGDGRASAIRALRRNIIDNGYRLSTGFVGTCILNEVLAEVGENDLAYSLLLQTDDPSWLYSVLQGATTIWETWGAYTKANGASSGSYNHYMFGAVQEWLYRHVAGIETTEEHPGFTHPILQPKPDTRTPEEMPDGQERITRISASFDSPVGMIRSAWDTTDGFTYDVTVPVASTLYLPVLSDRETFTVNGKTHRFGDYETSPDGQAVVIPLPAGTYTIIE